MAAHLSHIFFPSGFQELFSIWELFPEAVPCAGGTGFIREQGRRIPVFPRDIISLNKIEELRKISRTERYLEIGAMVKLNQIINLGKVVPEAITRCLTLVADLQVRNQATIGGNICFPSHKLDACAPMIALDAKYELRTATSSRWISASQFSSLAGPSALGSKELLTRIRVPLEPWTFTCCSKFHNAASNEGDGLILFIMRNQKNILAAIRIVYAGKKVLREKNSETMFLGKRLPLDRRNADALVDCWKSYLSGMETEESLTELTKTRISNFIKNMARHISD